MVKYRPLPISKMSKNFPKWCIIPNILVLHFRENFMKIQTKIAKLQMHENLHQNVNEYIKATMLYTANFLYALFSIHLKWWSSSFRLHQIFQILMIQMFFAQSPWPDLRKVGNSLKPVQVADQARQTNLSN